MNKCKHDNIHVVEYASGHQYHYDFNLDESVYSPYIIKCNDCGAEIDWQTITFKMPTLRSVEQPEFYECDLSRDEVGGYR